MSIAIHRSALLEELPHGFLGRPGGVSSGELAGLNVGYGSSDDRAAIAENRRRAVEAVAPGTRLVTVHQVHGTDCVTAGDWPDDARPHADALVTDRPGLLIGVLTADCAPVLLADPKAGVVGAAHAGWRGALAGITDSAIDAMERLGARREQVRAAVGPCIAGASYEVDEAFRARFLAADRDNQRFFSPGPGDRPHFDLSGYVADRLRRAGIAEADVLGLDTYADAAAFYSYRRATHFGEADYGRQLSAIALPAG